MLLSPDIEISKYHDDKYILHNGKKRYFVINKDLYELIGILEESETLEEAYKSYTSNGADQTFPEFESQINEFLKGKDILADDGEATKPAKKRHRLVRIRITLIPAKLAGTISHLLDPLYDKRSFFVMFAVFLIATLIFLSFNDKSALENSVKESDLLYVFIIFVLSALLHELGHISACKKFGGKHGGVGIGLYLIIPVFWADIHGIWMLPKRERLIANLAGIYIQVLLSFVLILIYLLNGSVYLLYSAYLISSAALFQLWPFIRLDGYWCVSDLTNAPNLNKRAFNELKLFFKKIVSKSRSDYLHSLNAERMILIGYSASFFLVIGVIVFFVFGF